MHNANLVEEFLDSEVYKEIIGPDIDDMLEDILGRKLDDGLWSGGSIALRKITDSDLRYLSGYASALSELSMKLREYIRDGKRAEAEILQGEEDDKFENPILDDYEEEEV